MFTVVGLLGPTLFQKVVVELDSSVVKDKISTAGVFSVSSILDPLQADFHPPHSNRTLFTTVTVDVFLASSLFSPLPLLPLCLWHPYILSQLS